MRKLSGAYEPKMILNFLKLFVAFPWVETSTGPGGFLGGYFAGITSGKLLTFFSRFILNPVKSSNQIKSS